MVLPRWDHTVLLCHDRGCWCAQVAKAQSCLLLTLLLQLVCVSGWSGHAWLLFLLSLLVDTCVPGQQCSLCWAGRVCTYAVHVRCCKRMHAGSSAGLKGLTAAVYSIGLYHATAGERHTPHADVRSVPACTSGRAAFDDHVLNANIFFFFLHWFSAVGLIFTLLGC